MSISAQREAFLAAGAPRVASYAGVVRGELELARGRPEHAVVELETALRDFTTRTSRAHADLVEAYARSGRADDAARTLATVAEGAAATSSPMALALMARLRGYLAADVKFDRHFQEALERCAALDYPLETARAELLYGERLRRARRRREAREHLLRAERIFETLRAEPWVERARAELTASGERLRRRDPFAEEHLTPQELQLALVVAEGATNKEAAAHLFISPKTVEAHLGSIYRKLGLRSRTELSARLSRASWS